MTDPVESVDPRAWCAPADERETMGTLGAEIVALCFGHRSHGTLSVGHHREWWFLSGKSE